MKMKKLEKWLLLEASGELSPRQLRRLGRELTASEDVRMLRQEIAQLRGSILSPEIELSPWTVAKIATRLREERRPVSTVRVLKPGFALATCLVLVVGILNFHGKQNSSSLATVVAAAGVDVWNDPLEEDLSRLERQIMAISGDSLDAMEM